MSTGKRRLLAYIMMIFSLMMSIKLVKDIIRLWHADDRLIKAEEELAAAEAEQIELSQQLKELEGQEWRESQVRDTLKMARSNEVVVVIPEAMRQAEKGEELKQSEEDEGLPNVEKWWKVFVY